MSTKINVRSPFYLNLSAPTVPTPEFTCSTAFPRGLDDTGFSVDNQGIITVPSPTYGQFESLSSSDSGFSNNKYATVSTDTTRTITARTRIPVGFSNTSSIHKDCILTTIQPGTSSSVVEPTVCAGGPTTSGSISAVALDTGGNSTTIDLSSKFSGETTYAVNNPNPSLISTSISGSNLIISSNTIGGTATIYAIGRDGSYPTTCEAVQSISVTISLPAGSPAFDCNTSPLTGGGIAADGTLTNPSTIADITASTPSTSANTTGSARDVTITFTLTVPAGYSNAGASITCPKTFSQQAQSVTPTFTCDLAELTGQSISTNGAVYVGSALRGTITDFTPVSFPTVTSNTSRSVDFTVQIPSEYTNAGGTITCTKPTIVQPATVDPCGLNEFYITSVGRSSVGGFCDAAYGTPRLIKSTASTLAGQLGAQICEGGTPYDGRDLFWGILTGFVVSAVGLGADKYYAVRINSSGIVTKLRLHTCDTGGSGSGSVLL